MFYLKKLLDTSMVTFVILQKVNQLDHVGPHCFEENLAGAVNLQIFNDFLLPQLKQLFLNRKDLWFHRDGQLAGRTYLNHVFPGK